MNTLDTNIFTDCMCPHLTGKTVDHIMLVNKHYNAVVKADIKHLYGLFWKIEGSEIDRFKHIFKDWKMEGEQLGWYPTGQLWSKSFYKEGKREGEQLDWYSNGQLMSKYFYKEGKLEGEQLEWWNSGQLSYKQFYKEGTWEGEQLFWWKDGQLHSKEFYNETITMASKRSII